MFVLNRKTPSTDAKKLRLELKDDLKKLKFERTGEVNRPLKQADFENGSSDDESSSEEERWRIFEESSGDEIDRTLENKADNMNLSALNVKSIIHVSQQGTHHESLRFQFNIHNTFYKPCYLENWYLVYAKTDMQISCAVTEQGFCFRKHGCNL